MSLDQCGFSKIKVSPLKFEFETIEGWKFIPQSQYLSLTKEGSGRGPNCDLLADEEWVSIGTKTGSVPCRIKVNVKSIGMSPGIYSSWITLYSHVDIIPSDSIEVILNVKPKESSEEDEDSEDDHEEVEPDEDGNNDEEEPEVPIEPDEDEEDEIGHKDECILCKIFKSMFRMS